MCFTGRTRLEGFGGDLEGFGRFWMVLGGFGGFWQQRGGLEGSRVSLLRCLGRSRNPNGVVLGSYVRCLGRVRGQQGKLFGSYLK